MRHHVAADVHEAVVDGEEGFQEETGHLQWDKRVRVQERANAGVVEGGTVDPHDRVLLVGDPHEGEHHKHNKEPDEERTDDAQRVGNQGDPRKHGGGDHVHDTTQDPTRCQRGQGIARRTRLGWLNSEQKTQNGVGDSFEDKEKHQGKREWNHKQWE